MILATVSSQSCLCWLYRSSPSFSANNIINLISMSTVWWCPRIESSLALQVVVFVQLLNHVWLFATPWTAAHQASLSLNISWSLLKLMSFESEMPANHLILCRSLLLLPSIFPSIQVFSNESALHIRWPKYWSLNFSISSFQLPMISFRIDWFDLLVVQGTLKSLLQHHCSKAGPE